MPAPTKRRILSYGNRKSDPQYWDVSTPELEAGGFLALFEELDSNWQLFAGMVSAPEEPVKPAEHPEGCRCNGCADYADRAKAYPAELAEHERFLKLYEAARAGNALAALRLLEIIKGQEYAEWSIEWVEQIVAEPMLDPSVNTPCNSMLVSDSGLCRHYNHGQPLDGFRPYSTLAEARKGLKQRGYELAYKLDDKKLWKGLIYTSAGGIETAPFEAIVSIVERWEMKRCPTHTRWDHRFKEG